MTTEEKARAYDEALERAREFQKSKDGLCVLTAESIFPELAESEDERIRRTLVEYFGPSAQLDFIRGVPIKKIRDWLEKQKEQKPAELKEDTQLLAGDYAISHYEQGKTYSASEVHKMLADAFTAGKSYQKPAEWSEEDESCIRNLESVIYYDKNLPTDTRIKLGDFLKSIRPQPKQGWSEEEIIFWNTIKDYFFGIPLDDKLKNALDWFKSLKPQPKQEWSDTNELVFQDICKHLKEEGCGGWVLFLNALRNGEFQPKQEWSDEDEKYLNRVINLWVNDFGEDSDTVKWLKSLRPSWKPSEEQNATRRK